MGMARRESEPPIRSLHVPFESQSGYSTGLVNALLGEQRASERIGPVLLTDSTSSSRGLNLGLDAEMRNRMERPPGRTQVQPTVWNLLAKVGPSDLETLKQIQELDPIEKP
jgi:hypothetical protein